MRVHDLRTQSRRALRGPALILFTLLIAVSVRARPVHVRDTEPLLPPRTLGLEELWRTGAGDGDQVLGMMIDSGLDAAGNVYLLDNQLCQVGVYSPEGVHLRTLSRRGEGPGEVRGPVALTFLPDGTLGLLEIFPAKMETVTLTGDPTGSVIFTSGQGAQTGFNFAVDCRYRGGVLLQAGMRSSPTDQGQRRLHYLARYSDTGEEIVRYCESQADLSFNPPVFVEPDVLPAFWFAHAVGPDGRVYAAPSRDKYRINVYAPDGDLLQVIERDVDLWPRDQRDRRRMQAMVNAWYSEFPGEIERTFADHEPAVSEMFVDQTGVLWVQHSRSGRDQPEGVLLTYDTFDPEGRFLQQVSIAVAGDPAYDGLRHLGDGRVLLIRGYVLSRWARLSPGGRVDFGEDHAGPMEVICCRIVAP